MNHPLWEKQIHWLVLFALSTLLLVSRFHYPPDEPATTLCGFKTVIGLPCPGCGLTRSFCTLAKGGLSRAFAFNLLGPPLFLFVLLWWLASLLRGLGFSALFNACQRFTYSSTFMKSLLFILATYWIARIVYLLTVYGSAATVGHGLFARLF
ncbi:MAG: DUF2752 domain-containing protein [Acidobacteriota bacterium]